MKWIEYEEYKFLKKFLKDKERCIKIMEGSTNMKYICMNCGKIYEDKFLPVVKEGDGCCTIGSLIELTDEVKTKFKNSKQILRKMYRV